MKLTISIDSDNAECSTRQDVCDLVKKLLPKMRTAEADVHHGIRDINGNCVGSFTISADDEYIADRLDDIDGGALDDEMYTK